MEEEMPRAKWRILEVSFYTKLTVWLSIIVMKRLINKVWFCGFRNISDRSCDCVLYKGNIVSFASADIVYECMGYNPVSKL